VLIPWDYDRLNDAGADIRGALKGRLWWDPSTATGCNSRLRTAYERGVIKGGTDMVQVAYWADIFQATPADVEVPISCDKIAQMMILALGSRIRQRTREFAGTMNRAAMQANIQTWTNQIQSALLRDPDGPQLADMANEQRLMLDRLMGTAQKAVTDANNGDRGIFSSPPVSASSGSNFVPKAQATGATTFSSSGTTFVPKAQANGQASGFVPMSQSWVPQPQASQQSSFTGFVPKQTSTSFSSFQPSFSQPSFSQPSFSSFKPSYQQYPAYPGVSSAPRYQPISNGFGSWQGR